MQVAVEIPDLAAAVRRGRQYLLHAQRQLTLAKLRQGLQPERKRGRLCIWCVKQGQSRAVGREVRSDLLRHFEAKNT
jgi:hypothetical protein